MGVEYRRYLIPRPNSFRPGSLAIARFIEVLTDQRWLYSPDAVRSPDATLLVPPGRKKEPISFPIDVSRISDLLAHDFSLRVWVQDLKENPVTYPFASTTCAPEEIYYHFEIHGADDYIYHVSEIIEPFASTNCLCSASLDYNPEFGARVFFEARLRMVCNKCGRSFDPSGLDAPMIDGWTGQRLPPVKGGATYRFAVVIDCGKCFPDPDSDTPIRPELKQLCESYFGVGFYDIGDIY